MCGRYALALRPSAVRRHLEESHMPSQDAPDDDDVRQSYNFAPGYYGLVYRADMPDHGAGGGHQSEHASQQDDAGGGGGAQEDTGVPDALESAEEPGKVQYKLQRMKWGLVPFWTKRNPEYGSMLKTINCRDDSLAASGGMWNTMKQKKRCIVIAQGFYEWLKKNGGKEKIPHYVKRKDGQLMCFAGLWDCVKYEDATEKLYTYTIITTDPNKQLSFLHDRMPVILENGSDDMFTWLDSNRPEWSKELQSLLKPYAGELECYPVTKEVGKVGNNSPSFIVPVASSENKQNIANFFGNQKKAAATAEAEKEASQEESEAELMGNKIEHDPDESRKTDMDAVDGENNAPKPVAGTKRQLEDSLADDVEEKRPEKSQKLDTTSSTTPRKVPATASSKRSRNATSNGTAVKSSPVKAGDGSAKITSFFSK